MPTSTVLAGELALDAFAGIIAAADLVISADTGAAHLATAYGIPSVVIFGPAPPEEWGPPASGPHIVLTDASQRLGDTFSAIPIRRSSRSRRPTSSRQPAPSTDTA
ncbi:glycosyltransferase family 9 protein [Clavibacter tessellarius]|uniref:glycosyltransferase family 9 protein n=1 Tax=Clavibacter tessellarius TaxID=31965 RepID=UPI003243ACC5